MLLSYGMTNIGMKRKTNQDSIFIQPGKRLYIVADGMGGHQGGDIASQMVVSQFPNYFYSKIKETDSQTALKESIIYVNNRILEKSREDEKLKGMGTTINAVYVDGTELKIANVGDSRTYLFNHKKVYQLSRDHSLVQEKIAHGIYDRETAAQDPQKNILTKTVGFESNVQSDIFSYSILKNDIFLLCSDGLNGLVSDRDISQIVNKNIPDPSSATELDLKQAVSELIDQANANGGNDNISIIMILAQ